MKNLFCFQQLIFQKIEGGPASICTQAIDHLQLNGVFLHPPDLERFCEKDNEQLYLALHFDDVPHLPVVDLPQPVEGAQPRDGTLLSIFQRQGKHKNDMALYHCSKTRYSKCKGDWLWSFSLSARCPCASQVIYSPVQTANLRLCCAMGGELYPLFSTVIMRGNFLQRRM